MPKRYLLKFNIGPSFKATNKASYQNKDMPKQFKSKGKTIKAFPLKLETRILQIHYFTVINMKAFASASRLSVEGVLVFSGKSKKIN